MATPGTGSAPGEVSIPGDVASPVENNAKPVEDYANPVENDANPVEDNANPVEDNANQVKDNANPVQEADLVQVADPGQGATIGQVDKPAEGVLEPEKQKNEEKAPDGVLEPEKAPPLLYDTRIYDCLFDLSEEETLEGRLLDSCSQVKVDMKLVLPDDYYDSLKGMSQVIGVPLEFLSHPLFVSTALMMNGTVVKVNEGYEDPVVMNNIICANSGTNKTGSYKKIEDALKVVQQEKVALAKAKFEEENRSQHDVNNSQPTDLKDGKRAREFDPAPHTLLLKKVTEKGFIQIMKSGANNVMLCYEELVLFFSMLDNRNKNNEFLPIFLQSYNASDVSMLTQSRGPEVIEKPFIQMLGFGQPMLVVEEMSRDPEDHLGTFNRMTLVCPPRMIKTLRQCHTSLENKPPLDFVTLFKAISKAHKEPRTYQLNEEAKELLYQVDEAQKMAIGEDPRNNELSGRYAKDFTKIVRVSAILCCLREVGINGSGLKDMTIDLDLEVDDEIYSSPKSDPIAENQQSFLIKREDVMGAVHYIQYTSGTLIQFRKASRQFVKTRMASPGNAKKEKKEQKVRGRLSWYDDQDKEKSGEFILQHSPKIVAIWKLAETDDGTRQLKFKEIKAKRMCWPQPSSNRNHTAAEMEDICKYFLQILEQKKFISMTKGGDVTIKNMAEELDDETFGLWNAIQAKHPGFKPFA